jgi:hypothetical protein
MKIRYKQKRLKYNLIFGSIWLIFALFSLFIIDSNKWMDLGYLLFAALHLGLYFYEFINQYITIENGMIRKNSLFSKKIKITDIIRIKKFAGDYILKTENTELNITIDFIEEKSLEELNSILRKLNLEPGNTPFADKVLK